MSGNVISLTPSEFMVGYLLGDYGNNHLQDEDDATQLLKSSTFVQVYEGPEKVRIVRPDLKVTIKPSAGVWGELISISESRITQGIDAADVLTWLVTEYFEAALLDSRPQMAPLRLLFDFIVEHLVGFQKSVSLGWDTGRMH